MWESAGMSLRATSAKRYAVALGAVLALALLLALSASGIAVAYADETQDASGQEELPSTITVQFREGIGVLGRIAEAPVDLTIYRAFEQTGAELPSASGEGKELKGWACSSDAEEALGNSTRLSDAYRIAGNDGMLFLYPVYGDVSQPHVSFYGQDGTTLLAEADIDSWQTIAEAGVAPDLQAKDEETQQLLFRKDGYWFAGWSDTDGVLHYRDEPIVESLTLTPAYAKLSVDLSGLKKAAADVSKAFLLYEDIESALDAGFRLEKSSAADASLESVAKEAGYRPFNAYRIVFGFKDREETTAIKKGFGSVTVTLPTELAENTEVRVYWLHEDGSVGQSAVKKVSKGGVTASFSDYSLIGKGNVLIAYKPPSSDSSDTKKSDSSKDSKNKKRKKSKSSSSAKKRTPSSTTPSTTTPTTTPQTSNPSSPSSGLATRTPSTPSTTYTSQNPGSTSTTTSTTTTTQNSAQSSSAATGSGSSALQNPAATTSSKNVQDDVDDDVDALDEDALRELLANGADGEPSAESAEEESEEISESAASKLGSKDGGVFYGASMLVIGLLAVLAWQLAARYERKQKDASPSDGPGEK